MSKKLLVINKPDMLIRKLFSSSFLTSYKITPQEQVEIYKDLAFTQANTSRKSINKAKSIRFVCDDEKIINRFENKIFYADIISQILETYLFGLNVFELNWDYKDGFYYPELIQRDFRNFKFDNNELKFNDNGVFIDIPKGKIVYALYESSAFFPYGDALLPKLYWAVKLKQASIRFWSSFQEKFGSPWVIAKTDANPEEIAIEVHAMLSGDTAAIGKEEEITLIQPTSTQNDFHSLVDFLDNCIRSAILGGNLSSQVDSGSFAAAQTHNDVRKDLANADLHLLLFVINKVLEHFKEINNYSGELYAELEPENDIKSELAQRDSIIYNMGFDLSEDYIKETYGVQGSKREINYMYPNKKDTIDATLKNANSTLIPNVFNKPIDTIDATLESKTYKDLSQKYDNDLKIELEKVLANSSSYEEAYEILNNAGFKDEDVETALNNALVNIGIKGACDD